MKTFAYLTLSLTVAYFMFQAGRAYSEAQDKNLQIAALHAECADLEQRVALAERRVMAQEQFFYRVAAGQFNYAPSIAACMHVMRGYATLASQHYPDSVLLMTPAQIDSALAKDPRSRTALHWNRNYQLK